MVQNLASDPEGCQTFEGTLHRRHLKMLINVVIILNFRTNSSGQTMQTQIRLLLEEQSDQGLHCLLFHLHLFGEISQGLASLFEF